MNSSEAEPIAFGEFEHIRTAKEEFKANLLKNNKRLTEWEAERQARKSACNNDRLYREGRVNKPK